MDQFIDNLKKERECLARKTVLFPQDCSRVHEFVVAMKKFYDLGFVHPQPPYSRNLVERHLSPKMKSMNDLEKYNYILERDQNIGENLD